MDEEASIKLPPPSLKGNISVEEAIARRRSVRRYKSEPLSLSQLSQVLWAAQGITNAQRRFRAAPSAGATYPLEVFVFSAKNGVDELGEGIYHYSVENHSLKLHRKGDLRAGLSMAALDQEFISEALADIAICAVYQRTSWEYGRWGERYVYMEVGHVGENIHLQATALGLATVAIGAFMDEEVREILQVDEQTKPLYIMPLGKPL